MINKRSVGSYFESLAASYLEDQGMEIIARNYRSRMGEIDLIGKEKAEEEIGYQKVLTDYLVFIEVKYRSGGISGDPTEAVDFHKRWQISKTALYFLQEKGYSEDTPIRFDVIGIDADLRVRHIRNAFPYTGK